MVILNKKLLFSLLVIGIISGCVGIFLTLLMHTLQHITFGVPLNETLYFRVMIEQASPLRRVLALLICGTFVGLGWFFIHRYGSPLIEIKAAIKDKEKNLPFKTTICHSLLQIITVAMGSPLGREVAPREMSAAFANRWTQLLKCNIDERKILIACASGAGLGAVYNVPFASVLFILETLLLSWDFISISSALICCGTAVFVMRIGLGDLVQYQISLPTFNQYMIIWALCVGPIIAIGVLLFNRSIKLLPKIPKSYPISIIIAIIAFGIIGIISIQFPEILGNGKAGNQLVFTDEINIHYGIGLFFSKWIVILIAMFAGAYGGRITPSMMLGALLAFISAYIWNLYLPIIPLASAGIIGATIFLGIAQNMPLTSIAFILELSRFSPEYLYPICLCFLTTMPTYYYLQKKIL